MPTEKRTEKIPDEPQTFDDRENLFKLIMKLEIAKTISSFFIVNIIREM